MRPEDYVRILDALGEGVYVVDRSRVITYWNAGAAAIAGYAAADMVGHACHDNRLAHVDDQGRHLCMEGCPLKATIEDGISREMQVYLRHRDGHRVPVRVQAWPLRGEDGAIVGAVEVFHDDAADRHARERMASLERDALIDQVTGVGNRRFADAMLASRLAESSRLGWPFGVMLVDVDRFKLINDGRGHLVGDRTLKTVAATMTAAIRSYDQVARWGGDEFLVLTRGLDESRMLALGERLRVLVAASRIRDEDNREFSVTVSIGLACAHPDDSVDSLLGRADTALYVSKERGRNTVSAG